MKNLVILFISISCLGLAFGEVYSGLQNKKVERTLDLSTQFARTSLQIELENTGSKSASEYYVAVQDFLEKHLAYLEAKDETGASLKVTKGATETSGKQSYTLYRVDLNSALSPQATTKISVLAVYSHVQTPFPASIGQDEKQLVTYTGNHFYFSPYKTVSQTTTVKLPSSSLESHSKEAPTSVSGNTITYGPYADKAAFSVSEMKLHFENNKSFLTATSVTKEIEISQWGNIAVEEAYELKHDGAKLKGHFSRFAYQRSYRLSSNVVAALKQKLPTGADDIYYRDEIGNISTSHVNFNSDEGIVMDVIPRYPLFGGWSIGFYFGYNLPTPSYLFTSYNDGSLYVLNVTFASNFEDVSVDDLTVRVILPEGATDIDFVTPFPVDSQSSATHFTYLDTSGRPVLIINKKNVVPEHNKPFQVLYRFSQTSLLREPILLIGAYFFLFAFILVYTRLPLSVGESKGRGPNSDRILGALAHLKEVSEQRNELHEALTEAVGNYVKSKNEKVFNVARKAAESTLNNLTKDVNGLLSELDEVAADLGKRVREAQKKEEKKAQIQSSLLDLEVTYKIRKAIDKSSYDAQKADLEKQYKILEEEVESAISDLTENL